MGAKNFHLKKKVFLISFAFKFFLQVLRIWNEHFFVSANSPYYLWLPFFLLSFPGPKIPGIGSAPCGKEIDIAEWCDCKPLPSKQKSAYIISMLLPKYLNKQEYFFHVLSCLAQCVQFLAACAL